MIVGAVQQPVNIQGYGNFPCSRKAFKNVGSPLIKIKY